MLKILPLLIDLAGHGEKVEDAFNVVVPNLPGYGFSDRPTRSGMDTAHMVDLFADLMKRLGYRRWGAHGSDWDSSITEQLAVRHSSNLVGIHLTDVP